MRSILGEQNRHDSMTDRRPVLRHDNSLFTNILPVKYLESIFCNPSQSSKSRKTMKSGSLRGFLENRPTRQFDAISLFFEYFTDKLFKINILHGLKLGISSLTQME